MTVRVSEQALWSICQFAAFNHRGLRDANAMVRALAAKRRVLYQVDFSDVHPYIFPEKAQDDLDRDDLALHGRSVKFLWETLLNTDLPSMPFQLALNPGAQLEALESLWHAEKRIHHRFVAQGGEFLSKHVHFSDDGVSLSRGEDLRSFLQKWDFHRFRRSLEACISDDALNKRLHEPVRNLLKLFDDGVLRNFNDCIGKEIAKDLVAKGVSDRVRHQVHEFLTRNPRAANEMSNWSMPHEQFHNQVDELNLCLAYSLRHTGSAAGLYSPVLTHTYRVISAGTRISDTPEDSIVHHSAAPLFYARAVTLEGEREVKALLANGLGLVQQIWDQLKLHPVVQELTALTPQNRANRLTEDRYTDIPVRLFERVKFFTQHYYHAIDSSDFIIGEPADGAVQAPDDREGPQEVTIEDIVELIRKKDDAIRTIKREAATVRRRFGISTGGGLSDLFTPRLGHAKDITDWLSDL
jgi:hypothetical protein